MATVEQQPDMAQVEEFAGRALGDVAGTMATVLCALGDKLGLFAALADGPATAHDLAHRAGVQERYALEWARGLTAAGYLEFDRASGRFALPPAHAPVLADEGGVLFLGGGYEELVAMLHLTDRIAESFRSGGGVPQAAYPDSAYEGMARLTRGWIDNHLVDDWLALIPGVRERLAAGLRWADVGCGTGRAVIHLAQAFPASSFLGVDIFPAQIERARDAARAAGVADRVSFEVADGGDGLPGTFDVISTFDVVHDSVDPSALVRGIRRSLADDGSYLMLEMNCEDDPADNAGPLATVLYGFSVLYCMTTSLAQGGAGLGTCGCPPAVVDEIGRAAGFGTVRELEIGDPFNRLYELRP